MPDNPSTNQPNTGSTTGTPGTSGCSLGNTGTSGTSLGTPATSSGGTGAGTAPALAQQYGQKLSDAATHAKDYLADKASVVSDKFKDLQNADLGELAENAKEYARRKPGQALLISAAVGLVLGLIVRGRR